MVIDSSNWFTKLSFVAHSTSHIESEEDLFPKQSSSQYHHENIKSNSSNQCFLSIEEEKLRTGATTGTEKVVASDGDGSSKSTSKSISTSTMLPLPRILFKLCRNGEWSTFIQKCREEPYMLSWEGCHGQNLLHFICTRRPDVESVLELLKNCPDALMKEDDDGCLPIHMAMTNGASHEVISTLISRAPETVLHTNKWDYYPLDWIWKRCKYELMHLNLDVEEDCYEENVVWNTVEIMIQAASTSSTSGKSGKSGKSAALRSGMMLHMAMDFDCPIDLVESIIAKFPKMVAKKDSMGRTPLARVISSQQQQYSIETIQVLLQENPEVALTADNNGRVPLHLAILRQIPWSEGLRELFDAAPLTIFMKDPVTNLFPFQLIASDSGKKESSFSVSDIFEVLTRCPALVCNTW